jgi:2-deoxy-D-gluconate 3-dehydrogenase
VLAARTESKLESAVAEITAEGAGDRVMAVTCDVTDRDSVQAALDATVAKFGGVDIVVNNAGANRRADEPHLLSDEDWRFVIDTNLTSMHNVTSLAFPLMKERGGGSIINIGSMMSIFGSPYASAYAASKGGVVQYTKSCAVAWAKYNVQVNAILPGWIVTEMTNEFGRLFPDRYALIEGRTPAGRWGQPADLAGTAVFLASDASQFVTGISIPVDGGYCIQ